MCWRFANSVPFQTQPAQICFSGLGWVLLVLFVGGACAPTSGPSQKQDVPQISADTLACLQQLPEVAKLPIQPELPPLLQHFCGLKPVKDPQDWTLNRRHEILGLFHHYVYGPPPQTPSNMKVELQNPVANVLNGTAVRKRYLIRPVGSSGPALDLLVYIPANKKPAPVFLGLNFFGNHTVMNDPDIPLARGWIPARGEGVENNQATEASRGTAVSRWAIEQNIRAGFAVATLYHGDLDPDQVDDVNWVHERFGATEDIRNKPGSGGTLNVWAWGLSRVLDVLQNDPDIDGKRVWVMGHSRNGKAALLAAARDTRFAGVISNQSGSMGESVNRGKEGETIPTIQPLFPHWFHARFAEFVSEPNRLPVDQHLLLALIAPRPVLISTATGDTWSDPKAAWRSVVAAQPVWGFLGVSQPTLSAATDVPAEQTLVGQTLAFHRRPGIHSITPEDWSLFVRFVSQHPAP